MKTKTISKILETDQSRRCVHPPDQVTATLEHGNQQAREVAAATMKEVRHAIGLPQG